MLIYVASPYSDPDPAVRHDRYLSVEAYCRWRIVDHSEIVFSPIVYLYNMADRFDMTGNTDFYRGLNYEFLRKCDLVRVFMLPGWLNSWGVKDETYVAGQLMIPIEYVDP